MSISWLEQIDHSWKLQSEVPAALFIWCVTLVAREVTEATEALYQPILASRLSEPWWVLG